MLNDDVEQRNSILAAIIESSEDAIISKDLQSQVISWNKAAEQMFGYREEEVVGKRIHLIIPEDRWQEEDMIISSLKKGERIEHYQTIRRTKAGKPIHVSISVSPIKNAQGVVVGASKIARDITRQKEQEEQIREHTKRMELINEVGKKIVANLDEDKILQMVTDATTELSGASFGAFFYNKVDAKGEAYMLFAMSGANREHFEKFGMPRNTAVFAPTFSGEGIVRSDDITKDPRYGKNSPHKGMPKGHLPVVSYLAVPVLSHTGMVIGGLFFGHPEPAKFKVDHELLVTALASQAAIALDNAKLYAEVQALNSKKDEFIGFASHELKTPLTTIKGYLQFVQEDSELTPSLLPKINKQVNRLEGIISDLLDISKIQAGKLQFSFSRHSLHTLIRESIDSVDADEHMIKYELPVKDLLVTIDPQKMMQVLVNLLSNAVKYSPKDSTINIEVIQLGDQIEISVSDQGVGINGDDLDKIFNQFYRVSNIANRVPGIGLGLYISKEIVERHQGRIWAESEPGKGSTFYLEFPVDRIKLNK